MKQGFTLVELAIVIVIIGLLVGGVLQGQELIEQAKIRSQIKQFEEINSATNTFKSKYNCLPGDCPNATTFFPSFCSNYTNGDNNGLVQTQSDINTYPMQLIGEVAAFFSQLYNSKIYINISHFICGGGTIGYDLLAAKCGRSRLIVVSIEGKNGYYWALSQSFNASTDAGYGYLISAYSKTGVVTPEQEYNFDLKIDDGSPMIGKVKAAYQYGGDNRAHFDHNTSGTSCVSSSIYNLANSNVICRLFIEGNF